MKFSTYICGASLAFIMALPLPAHAETTDAMNANNAKMSVITREQVESFVKQAEQNFKTPDQMDMFMKQHMADDAEIWMKTSLESGGETIGNGAITLTKDQFIRMHGIDPLAGKTGDITFNLTDFKPIGDSSVAKATTEFSQKISGLNGQSIERKSVCENMVWMSGETLMMGDMKCESNVKL
jgi:hypothetical protein